MPIPFLTTHWRNLLVATYAAPEELLVKYLPTGVELDLRDGRAFCSLVGFQFQSTSVFGIPSPCLNNFPEWNLRIYVRRGEKRGIHFVREFVPHRLVTWAGRLTFNEPFKTALVTVDVKTDGGVLNVDYYVTRGGRTHRLSASADAATSAATDTEAHFTDLYWGFGESREFRIERPAWEMHRLRQFDIDVDWAELYGPDWAGLNGRKPESVCLSAGSRVKVFTPSTPRVSAGFALPPAIRGA